MIPTTTASSSAFPYFMDDSGGLLSGGGASSLPGTPRLITSTHHHHHHHTTTTTIYSPSPITPHMMMNMNNNNSKYFFVVQCPWCHYHFLLVSSDKSVVVCRHQQGIVNPWCLKRLAVYDYYPTIEEIENTPDLLPKPMTYVKKCPNCNQSITLDATMEVIVCHMCSCTFKQPVQIPMKIDRQLTDLQRRAILDPITSTTQSLGPVQPFCTPQDIEQRIRQLSLCSPSLKVGLPSQMGPTPTV